MERNWVHTEIDRIKAAARAITCDDRTVGIFGVSTLPGLQRGFADICKLPALCAPSHLADSPCAAINGPYGAGDVFRNGLLENWIIGGLVLYRFGNHNGSYNRLLLRRC
ncbi:hypothetical protein RRF57_012250 [Xylaria bambusicola]|uniref:Uncharacterized protein n=1 Tax=Xylaria bambusicola TaxID=326684 RepID=A0AAN7V3N8_9PEZI